MKKAKNKAKKRKKSATITVQIRVARPEPTAEMKQFDEAVRGLSTADLEHHMIENEAESAAQLLEQTKLDSQQASLTARQIATGGRFTVLMDLLASRA